MRRTTLYALELSESGTVLASTACLGSAELGDDLSSCACAGRAQAQNRAQGAANPARKRVS